MFNVTLLLAAWALLAFACLVIVALGMRTPRR